MEPKEIIRLFWNRDERAIDETEAVFGAYARTIARNICGSEEDAEECVNDAFLRVWNTIPPQCPSDLKSYIGRIVRNISIDRTRKNHAAKRGGGVLPELLSELSECIASTENVERVVEMSELTQKLNGFLSERPERERNIFLLRYFYAMPIEEISRKCGVSLSSVKVSLHRTRKKLKNFLEQEDTIG